MTMIEAPVDERQKKFATFRAQLGMREYTLARTDPNDGPVEFVVGFRGYHKVLRTLGAVESFAREIGAIK